MTLMHARPTHPLVAEAASRTAAPSAAERGTISRSSGM